MLGIAAYLSLTGGRLDGRRNLLKRESSKNWISFRKLPEDILVPSNNLNNKTRYGFSILYLATTLVEHAVAPFVLKQSESWAFNLDCVKGLRWLSYIRTFVGNSNTVSRPFWAVPLSRKSCILCGRSIKMWRLVSFFAACCNAVWTTQKQSTITQVRCLNSSCWCRSGAY